MEERLFEADDRFPAELAQHPSIANPQLISDTLRIPSTRSNP
jgi:hypothetical protein